MNIKSIQKRISQIDKFELENKTSKNLLKDELDNDESYSNANKEAKEANAKKKNIKEQILSSPSNQEVVAKIKENNEEIATLKEILSAELVEFYQKSKSDFIEDSTGEQRKFKVEVKLLPIKSGGFRPGQQDEYIEIPM